MYNTTKPYKTKINEYIQQTWNAKYCTVEMNGLYPVVRNIRSHDNSKGYEVAHTDGIGTKGIYHWANRSFRNAVIDALCMNINDLLMAKAHPCSIQNHLFLPEDDHAAIEKIIFEMSIICKQSGIAITGGETAIHNNIQGMDISMTMTGIINDIDLGFRNRIKEDDVIIAYKSSGLHSNGFTRVRELIPLEKVIDNKGALDLLCTPTKNYATKTNCYGDHIHGIMHITGGAFAKIKDILPSNLDAHITALDKANGDHSAIFHKLYGKIQDDKEMYKTFNCGVGLIFTTSMHNLKNLVEDDYIVIGYVKKGTGKIAITSQFSGNIIEL